MVSAPESRGVFPRRLAPIVPYRAPFESGLRAAAASNRDRPWTDKEERRMAGKTQAAKEGAAKAGAANRDDLVVMHLKALRMAMFVIALILTGFTLWVLRRILEPFVLALFLLIMIDGLARAIERRVPAYPRVAALPTAIVAILAIFGLTLWLTIDNAADFAAQSPVYTQRINALLVSGANTLGLS